MKKHIFTLTLITFFIASQVILLAEEDGVKTLKTETVSDQEIDAKLEELFEKYAKLKVISGHLVQTKEGGVFTRPVRKEGTLKANIPDLFILDMSADGLKIMVDGTYAWIIDTDLDDVERWDWKAFTKGGRGIDVSGLFFGGTVKTAAEVRKDFDITATRQLETLYFILTPKTEKLAEKWQCLKIDITDGNILPDKVVMISAKDKGDDARPPAVTTQELSQVKTNLDGLETFPVSEFRFTANEDMELRDMSAAEGQKSLTPEKADQDAKEAIKTQKQKNVETAE